mmetsp:Transcript_41553/g.96734  ORF Transcript_41553/g.96734 Transcript_41553/m.96734 type:complete len:575 (+) Transcript_41553:68-1792(+)
MDAPLEQVQDALRKLEEVEQQQKASFSGIEMLAAQHRDWQAAVGRMMEEVGLALRREEETRGAPMQPVLSQASRMTGNSPDCASLRSDPEEVNEAIPQEGEAIRVEVANENEDETEHGHDKAKLNRLDAVSFLRKGPKMPSKHNLTTAGPLSKLVMELMPREDIQMAPVRGWSWLRQKAKDLVASQWFETLAGCIILVNLLTIGAEAQLSLNDGDVPWILPWLGVIEIAFLVVYTVEVVIRVLAGGRSVFWDLWFLMDLALVIIGLLALVILPGISSFGVGMEGFEKFLVVRGLRLLRLVRALRTFRYFKIMWRLVSALLSCGQTILSTTLLIIIFLFICACVAIELIAKDDQLLHDERTKWIVEYHFTGLFKASLTFLQFATLDSIAGVYYPLIMVKPELFCFFAPMLIFISIGLMNLVTAVLVENALEQSAEQAEADKKELQESLKRAIPALIDVFNDLDEDHNGMLTYEELQNVFLEDFVPRRLMDSIHVETMADFFQYLDVDASGEVSQTEFVEGLLHFYLQDVPIWTIQTLKLLKRINAQVQNLQHGKPSLHDKPAFRKSDLAALPALP